MTQTISIVMTGQLPIPPYEAVFWTVYNEPDPTGAQSQYGAGYLLNIGVDSISIDGAAVNPLTLTVGGDLTGSLPNPYVSGLQGNPISVTIPTTGQTLTWNGTVWIPTTPAAPGAISLDIPEGNTFSITQDTRTSNTSTHNITIQTQAPFASATGSNRLPGNLQFTIPAASGALAATTSGEINFNYGALNFFKFYADISTPQSILQFPHNGQILQCTSLSSSTNLGLGIGIGSKLTTTVSGVDLMEFSDAGGGQGFINLKSKGSIESGILTITATDTDLTIGATAILNLNGSTVSMSAGGTMALDSPDFEITSAGNISASCDNLMTFTAGGDFTLNNNAGLFSIINQGAGILISDPAGAGITIDCNGGGELDILAGSGLLLSAGVVTLDGSGGSVGFAANVNQTASGTGYVFDIFGSDDTQTSGTGGLIQINPGQGASSHHGNVALFSTPSSAAGTAGGSYTLWIGDRAVAPGTNPSGGIIVYSESGVAKIRSVGNTVTLGNKPSVTGSKASGAALISLLTVLATAGLITDNTTA